MLTTKQEKRRLFVKKKRKLFTKLRNTGAFDKQIIQVDKHPKVPLSRKIIANVMIAVLVVYRFFLRIRVKIENRYHF